MVSAEEFLLLRAAVHRHAFKGQQEFLALDPAAEAGQ